MTHKEKNVKKTNAEKFADFISANKKIFWGMLAVIIVITAVVVIIEQKNQTTDINNSEIAIQVQADFQEWFAASEEEKENLEKNLLEKIEDILSTNENNILVGRVLFIRGKFFIQKEDWEKASSDFSRIAEISPDNYLASVSLYNSASANENGGDLETALSILKHIVADYKTNSPIIPEVLFNIGRLNETLNKKSEAIVAYEELASTYSSSNWTNLAKTRIISLKASGASN